MDDTPCRRFFLEPTQPLHRRFAALQAFFVEGLSPQVIGERLGLAYHTVRSWVRDFRAQCRAGDVPPFLPNRAGGVHAALPTANRHGPKSRPRPTAVKSAWPWAGACVPASPGCSCFCRCWRACTSTRSCARPATRARGWSRRSAPC